MKFELKGLYVITDKKLIERPFFIESVEKALSGGANILHEIVYLGKELLKISRLYSVPLIINDSPQLVREIGADGVHLGKGDTTIEKARKIIGADKIIGVSCYGQIEKGVDAEIRGADYVAFGTPYNTPTKPGRIPTSFSTLIEAKTKITKIPIFAIGGITKENAQDVLVTGVDGIAVITSVFGSDNPKTACIELSQILNN